MTDFTNMNIGLVLSGGGAKGAYQIGMLRALEELGISERISVISGCSIGAFNGLCYATGGIQKMREFMNAFYDCYERGMDTDIDILELAKRQVLNDAVDIREFVINPQYRRSSSKPLQEYMRLCLPDALLAQYKTKVLVCAYSLEDECPRYFELNKLDGETQRRLVIASGSLSFVFPPVEYRGQHYLDGGEIPEICLNGKPEDKIPLTPITDMKLDAIIVSFLIPSDTVDSGALPASTKYYELRPSVPLEAYPGAGTLDFSPDTLASHEELGYNDTIRYFSK